MVNLKEHQKLLYLTRLLQIYTRFLKAYSSVDVEIVEREKILVNRSVRKRLIYGDNEIEVEVLIPYETDIPKTRYIRIIYKDVKISTYGTWSIEFPISHLPKRIQHYKRKVKTSFKNRVKLNN